MPWTVIKRKCRQSDGSSGSYVVLKEKGDGSTEQSSCHTSKEKAQGSVAARKMSEGRKMKITKRQLRRIIREAMTQKFTPDEINQYLSDNAKNYHKDSALVASGPEAIKGLLQDDFMDDIGHQTSMDDYEDLIDQLAKDPDALDGKGFTLPKAPSTHSQEHQRRRTFRNR